MLPITRRSENVSEVVVDMSRNMFLSIILLVNSHHMDVPIHSIKVISKNIMRKIVPQVNNVNLNVSFIFYVKFYFYIIPI